MGKKNKKGGVLVAVQRVGKEVVPDGTFAKGGEWVGRRVGKMVPIFGEPASQIGGGLGKILGGAISRLVGFGDYKVMMNSLAAPHQLMEKADLPKGMQAPSFGKTKFGTRIQHREFVGNVVVPSLPLGFVNVLFVFNPGDSTTFPWLSGIAQGFQQYKVHGAIAAFRSLSSDISAGGPLGTVVIASNYNVLDSAYTTKLDMENSEFAVSTKPSQSMIHMFECAPTERAQDILYVRSDESSPTTSQDARLYDFCSLQVATEGLPGSAGEVLGELWISYDIEFLKPKLLAQPVAKLASGGTVSKTAVFGTAPVIDGSIISQVDPNTIEFLVGGTYQVTMNANGTGMAIGVETFDVVKQRNLGAANTTSFRIGTDLVVVERGDTMSWDFSAATSVTAATLTIGSFKESYV
jgi:DNA-binding protein